MKPLPALLLAACAAACSVPGPREPDRYFILEAATSESSRSGPSVAVAPTVAASFYDTQDIAYSRSPGTRAYYQFNHWTERPQASIHRLLAQRLEGAGRKSGLRLETRLEEIYHDAAQEPGTARITIAAELVDAANGEVLARRTFSGSAPATSYDAPGAVRGFNAALAVLAGDMMAWVDAQARRPR